MAMVFYQKKKEIGLLIIIKRKKSIYCKNFYFYVFLFLFFLFLLFSSSFRFYSVFFLFFFSFLFPSYLCEDLFFPHLFSNKFAWEVEELKWFDASEFASECQQAKKTKSQIHFSWFKKDERIRPFFAAEM